ncbi:hypothetical protein Lalb_Chr03g0032271 [Lupinus albus]|uniref:Uncharacterized protein n=1 Tax=Lupinus albus TaxID=3870 RepID=A0A6A4QUP8_LUPAL|nr:hypothetical protein Lalb_Chr03g0032271 [Lupinus albus]
MFHYLVSNTGNTPYSTKRKTRALSSCLYPLQGDFPEVIEEYLQHGSMKCIAFNRRGTLLAGMLFITCSLNFLYLRVPLKFYIFFKEKTLRIS